MKNNKKTKLERRKERPKILNLNAGCETTIEFFTIRVSVRLFDRSEVT